jgi:modification methylase
MFARAATVVTVKGRRATATSNFGVGRRESHDATAFYDRFRSPDLSTDDNVLPVRPIAEPFVHGDARHMDAIPDGTVALVVTSPPYFAGKQYEEELARDGVPSSYLDYLTMLAEVFAECVRKLEPGGRIAVNVANLGRKPYRSLSADVIRILEDDLQLLLRGELIWQKAEGANGSCAWGSFRSAANPVLRDITERVVVASKGRFDRARSPKQRAAEGLPHESTMLTDDFLSSTLDVWSIPSESARRVGHPAPFPVELPAALIRLYTYRDDLVIDPFMGSGSTLVAAARSGRRFAGYDLDGEYVEIARRRVAEALSESDPVPTETFSDSDGASALAEAALTAAGFRVTGRRRRIAGSGAVVDLVAEDAAGRPYWFLIGGVHTSRRGGLTRTEDVLRSLGRAAALRGRAPETPVVLLATALPARRSDGDLALRAAGHAIGVEAIDVLSDEGRSRLQARAIATGRKPYTSR